MSKLYTLIEIIAKAEREYKIDAARLRLTDTEPGPDDTVIYKIQTASQEVMWLLSLVKLPGKLKRGVYETHATPAAGPKISRRRNIQPGDRKTARGKRAAGQKPLL
jgi:hypothetical protein